MTKEKNEELEALKKTQEEEAAALGAYNQAQYDNVGQILSDVQSRIDVAKAKDETATKRENAYRYISGLGDTLSGIANLVGTAHGAANQNQTYNSHAVVQKAEEARKARKLEMDDLNKRLDEMTTRQKELKAAGSLAEAQLKAKQDKEQAALLSNQRAKKIAADQAAAELGIKQGELAIKQGELAIKGVQAQTAAQKAADDAAYKSGMLGIRQQEAGEKAKKQKEYTRNKQFGRMISFTDDKDSPFTIGEFTLRRNAEYALPTIKEDIAQKAGFGSYAEYAQWKRSGERQKKKFLKDHQIDETLAKELGRLDLADVSDVEDIVKKYGRMSPTFMAQLKSAAAQEQAEFDAIWGDDEEEDDDEVVLDNDKLTEKLGFTVVK